MHNKKNNIEKNIKFTRLGELFRYLISKSNGKSYDLNIILVVLCNIKTNNIYM